MSREGAERWEKALEKGIGSQENQKHSKPEWLIYVGKDDLEEEKWSSGAGEIQGRGGRGTPARMTL